MGGSIALHSQPNSGTTFTITLPRIVQVNKTTSEEPIEYRPPSPLTQQNLAETTILIIDDDPAVRSLMQHHLSDTGATLITAENGEVGLRLAAELQPDIITLDILMPGKDGWAVLSDLKKDPNLADIPVIVLSFMDNQTLGYALGATDYLSKPIDKDDLLKTLQKYDAHLQGQAGKENPILVVEDDPATREMLVRLMERAGWSTLNAENGQAALNLLAYHHPSLILLDLMMPQMDGFDFVLALRQNPAWQKIPVIVISAMELSTADRRRLNGYVEEIFKKGAYEREVLLQEIKHRIITHLQNRPTT
jgi:CheY-like chemotaxis protein